MQGVPLSVNPFGGLNGVALPEIPTVACPPAAIVVNQTAGVKVPVEPVRVTVPLIPLALTIFSVEELLGRLIEIML